MSTETASAAASRESQPKHAFRGYLSPGLSFASGHSIWFFKLDSNPTRVGPYSEIWMVTPEGKRILYGDPTEAAEITVTQHDYDEVRACKLEWRWPRDSTLRVDMRAADGTELSFEAELKRSPMTRVLNGLLKLAPPQLMIRPAMTSVAKLLANGLLRLDVNVAGTTETGKRFANQADRLMLVRRASATLDGQDLGGLLVPPTNPVSWGDVKQTSRPFFLFGTLYLEVDERFLASA